MAAKTIASFDHLTQEGERASRREFGNLDLVKDTVRDQWGWRYIVVETERTPESVIRGLRTAVRELDSELALFRVRSMQQLISDSLQDTKLQTILLGSFALLGLLLSAVGIYGVTAYLVTQRTHEIGLRVARGAQQRDILQLLIGRGSGWPLPASPRECCWPSR